MRAASFRNMKTHAIVKLCRLVACVYGQHRNTVTCTAFNRIICQIYLTSIPTRPATLITTFLAFRFLKTMPAWLLLPVPWEVTVSFGAGTSRAADHIFKASLQVDLFDADVKDGWQAVAFTCGPCDKKILLKSDYLRKEAELYIDYISKGDDVLANKFMCKSLKEINEGSEVLNEWVYEQCKELLQKDKLWALLVATTALPLAILKLSAKNMATLAYCRLMRIAICA